MSVFGPRDVRDSRGREDSHTHAAQAAEQSGSSVTSTDRNRRVCGGGCALFPPRLSESAHSRSYDRARRIIQAD